MENLKLTTEEKSLLTSILTQLANLLPNEPDEIVGAYILNSEDFLIKFCEEEKDTFINILKKIHDQ